MREYGFSHSYFPVYRIIGVRENPYFAYFTPWIFCSGIAIDDLHSQLNFLFTRVIFACDLEQLASFSNGRNTSGRMLCNTCNFNKNSTPLQVFFYVFMRLIVQNSKTRNIFVFKSFFFSLRKTIIKIEVWKLEWLPYH